MGAVHALAIARRNDWMPAQSDCVLAYVTRRRVPICAQGRPAGEARCAYCEGRRKKRKTRS